MRGSPSPRLPPLLSLKPRCPGGPSLHYPSLSLSPSLSDVAALLGYGRPGLSALVRRVLGFHPPKSKAVALSNWDAPALTRTQLS